MLNEEEIRSLIVMKIRNAAGEGTYAAASRIEREIVMLVAVLTGKKPIERAGYCPSYLDAANIPYHLNNNEFSFDEEWLKAHGFILGRRYEGSLEHPRFGFW